MKLKGKIINSFKGINQSGKRFPITLGFSLLFVVLRIYMREMDDSLSSVLLEKLNRISMVIGLGIPLSLTIELMVERFFKKDKLKTIIFHGLGFLFLFFYYYFLLEEINTVSLIRYAGLWMVLIITFFYIARVSLSDDYEKYVIDLFSQIFLTILYSLVLLLGIFFILFTIDQLFDIDMKGKYYYYVFLVISQIFAVAFLLSKLAKPFEKFSEKTYSKSLKILLSYIVIPLISIYTIILYIYFGKILIQWDWPKSLVSHLVLWYSAVSVGVIFLITPVVEENKVCKNFKKFFPKLILPVLLMMFISIGIRINQYGITENRYYVLALGFWVTAMMLFLSTGGRKKNIIIPITLSLIILNSVFGPLSSFSVSKYNQNKRFEKILESNNMILNNKIIKNANIDEKSKKEINNILEYFQSSHSLSEVKYIEKGFDFNNMKEVFGFKYTEYHDYDYDEYFSFHRYNVIESIEVSGYDYFVELRHLGEDLGTRIDNILIKQEKNGVLKIIKEDKILLEINLVEISKTLYDGFEGNKDSKYGGTTEEMTYEFEDERIRVKFIFNEISGNIGKDSKEINIDNFSYLLFIKIK